MTNPQPDGRSAGFTLVELLVVIGVIAILISAVIVAGGAVVSQAKSRTTRATLLVVRDAIEEFAREQQASPTIVRAPMGSGGTYADRYGHYPPDELDLFSQHGLFKDDPPPRLKLVRATDGEIFPEVTQQTYGSMEFRVDLSPVDAANEHRDLAALILAIELYGDASAGLLAQVPDRHRTEGALSANGLPSQYLERNGTPDFQPADDLQIRYIVDDWGVPLSYLAQRDWDPDPQAANIESTNHPYWNQASTQLVRLNGDQPLIFSYGPNGKEQCSVDWMGAESGNPAKASLVADWMRAEATLTTFGRIDHPLNEDNIYPDAELTAKLARGVGQ